MKKLLLFTLTFFFLSPPSICLSAPINEEEIIDQPLPEPGKAVRSPVKPGKPAPAIPQPPSPPDPNSIISEKNLFRPDRKDWVMDDATALGEKDRGQKKVKPKLQLFGTIIIGDKKRAIIRMPQPAKGMANREIYTPGDYIGDYVLQEVEERKAVLDYYGEKVTLLLSEDKVRPKGDRTEIAAATPPPAPVAPVAAGAPVSAETEAKTSALREAIEQARQGIKPPPATTADGLIRINPFMSRQERKEAIEHNRKLLEERRKAAGGG
jgi:hypothetical protein